MESRSWLPCSQEPATGPYPGLNISRPHPYPHLFKIHFNSILSSTLSSYRRSLPFKYSDWNFVWIWHVPCLLHAWPISSSLIDHPNNIRPTVQIMKLLIVFFQIFFSMLPMYVFSETCLYFSLVTAPLLPTECELRLPEGEIHAQWHEVTWRGCCWETNNWRLHVFGERRDVTVVLGSWRLLRC
jgi:hypothetical protein